MSITRRGLRLRVYVYKGLYISLLKNKYCISYYTSIIVELVFPVNYFVYHIEIHSTGIEPANIDPLRGNAMSTTRLALRLWMYFNMVFVVGIRTLLHGCTKLPGDSLNQCGRTFE